MKYIANQIFVHSQSIKIFYSIGPKLINIGWFYEGNNGLKAIQYLEPNIALIDTSVPNPNVYELISEFASKLPELPVILMGDEIDPAYITNTMQRGIHSYVQRPFTGDELMEAVYSVYNNSS